MLSLHDLNDPDITLETVWSTHHDPIVFSRVKGPWGEFQNFAPGLLEVASVKFETSEALYQAMRFTGHPAIQAVIASQHNGYGAKSVSRENTHLTRADWDAVRVPIMEWTVLVRLMQQPKLRDTLLRSGNRTIIERSSKDAFWGAMNRDGDLIGANMLGRIYMRARDLISEPDPLMAVAPLDIPSFNLLGQNIPVIGRR